MTTLFHTIFWITESLVLIFGLVSKWRPLGFVMPMFFWALMSYGIFAVLVLAWTLVSSVFTDLVLPLWKNNPAGTVITFVVIGIGIYAVWVMLCVFAQAGANAINRLTK